MECHRDVQSQNNSNELMAAHDCSLVMVKSDIRSDVWPMDLGSRVLVNPISRDSSCLKILLSSTEARAP